MPLIRDLEHFELTKHEGVYFLMRDSANQVLCKVSHEALRDRSAKDGQNATLADTFIRHRDCIETIAGAKYDKGHRTNDLILVLSHELTPMEM